MRHGSLFSGIGGFDLAAEWMGWENVFHCEWIEDKRKLLKKHFPKSESYGDIQEFDGRKFRGQIDILSGGFPCQDISIAQNKNGGAKGIKGERSGLWKHYARLLGEIRPGIIVFENSPMLTVRGFERVLCDLHKLGYDAEWRYFYASQFGFPHLRERIYCLAYAREQRWVGCTRQGGILQKIIPERTPRPTDIQLPSQRFNANSDYSCVRIHDGFSKKLDRTRIHGLGNAIIPQIAHTIFKAIEQYESL